MTACFAGKPITKQAPANNETYKVEYLFEHDGCRVYRFQDMGNWVYFTNCDGDVTAISNDSTATRVSTLGGRKYTEQTK